jgi:RNA polymerase sigma factor (sigma-70 family)
LADSHKHDHLLGSAETPPVQPSPQSELRLVERWDRDIRRAAGCRANLIGRHADANDLAQEARIRLVFVARNAGVTSEPYIRKVIANAVLAAALRDRERMELDVLSDELPAVATDGHDLYAVDAVARWAKDLPPKLNTLYHVLYHEERTQREAAAILGVSQPRVAQLHRALLKRGRTELRHLAA